MADVNDIVFDAVEDDGNTVTLKVVRPTVEDQYEAQKVRNRSFSDALNSNAILDSQLNDVMRTRGLWTDEDEANWTSIIENLRNGEKRLKQGGFSLNEARELALKMRGWRDDMKELLIKRNQLNDRTAEAQANNASFNYLVSVCTVYNNNGQPYFDGLQDYLNKAGTNVGKLCAGKLFELQFGASTDLDHTLVENQFLKEYDFVDEELRLVNKQGRLIDDEGRLINEEGRFVNEAGNFVDIDGNPVDAEGDLVVEFSPFLDDDGNPVEQEKQEEPQTDETTE